ncbi:carbohydrate porin [Sphingomonas sp. M1-B02]|uniref:carbohydrate porin n=1 Tax=Sphingomonas sp. M1-B02 TaxID=3114300 RepID=UPI00223EF285|nr:carbohydrate porin [Sphingomonas sp. S6-11]UZK66320.1 carbohydrate porin [Sphingomonas sp. S6-11]
MNDQESGPHSYWHFSGSRLAVAMILVIALALPGRSDAQSVPPAAAAQHHAENGEAALQSADTLAIALTYTSDANADVSGGMRTGAAYLQRVGVTGDLDMARAVGWNGATAHISVHSIIGTGLSASRVGNLLTVSGIEASPALRLFNLWIEQKLGNSASLRVGQFTAGQEFAISSTANFFVNSTFGWPGSFAVDLPGGGPAYPIAVPGIRFATTRDSGKTTIRAALFAANPLGRDLRGLAGWEFRGQPLAIAELARTAGGDDPIWSVAIGGWHSFDRFANVRSPSGIPRNGNGALYVIGDALLWQHGARKVHGFARLTASPNDLNTINRYFDAGVTMEGLFASRPHDVAGLAVAAAALSNSTDSRRGGASRAEIAIEASYQLRFGTNLYVQPNAQLIIPPSRGVDGPASSRQRGRATVVGIRTSLQL